MLVTRYIVNLIDLDVDNPYTAVAYKSVPITPEYVPRSNTDSA